MSRGITAGTGRSAPTDRQPRQQAKGQAERGERTRQAIVDAAIEVFAGRGFRSGALVEIAARVDLTPGGILYHFGSKDALLVAVIAERDRRATALLVELVADHPIAGLDSLRLLIEIARLGEREPGLAALHTVLQVEALSPDAPSHGYFLDRSRLVRSWLERVLLVAREAGEVRPDVDCSAKAREVLAFLEGASILWQLDEEVSLVDLYEDYLRSLIAGIRVAPGPGG
jgi:AcrR family transcriptional regulator